jgi:hypothetical protein
VLIFNPAYAHFSLNPGIQGSRKQSQNKKEDGMSKKILAVLIGVLVVFTFTALCAAE